ncbi:MAG: substrate-binding domain-containing protein [Anaerolineales bacterium]|nr:substrate-binding domain-containing protein [Anaerolineales bacterium]
MTQALRIGLLADSTDPFWVEVRETIWQHAEPRNAGAFFGVDGFNAFAPLPPIELIEIHLSAEARMGHDALNRVEEILALNLGALVAVPFAMPVIRKLLDAGLPVISLHARDIQHPLFTSPTSLYATACLACEFLAERMGGHGRVLGIGGHGGAPETRSSRVQAALDVFAHFPGIEFVHVSTPWNYGDAYAPLCSALEGVTQRFDGVFGLSDTLALLGQKVSVQHGLLRRYATVVGINGDPLAIAAIARGDMTATVATTAAHIALEALRLACEAAQGQPLPRHFDYHPQLITIENVSEIALTKLLAIADVPSRLVGVNLRQEEQRLTQLQTSLEINRRIGSIP